MNPENGRYFCRDCGGQYLSGDQLLQHMETAHSDAAQLRCSFCAKQLPSSCLLREHRLAHSARSYSCSRCGKTYRDIRFLKHHARRHSVTEPCEFVESSEIDPELVRAELERHPSPPAASPPSLPSHVCETCGRGYKSAALLRYHVNRHRGVRPYVCEVCGKGFTAPGTLHNHKLSHGDYLIPCGQCGRLFKQRHQLNKHMMTHAASRSHACTLCEWKFYTAFNLRVHMRTHTGEKPFACTACRMKLTTRGHLKLHLTRCPVLRGDTHRGDT